MKITSKPAGRTSWPLALPATEVLTPARTEYSIVQSIVQYSLASYRGIDPQLGRVLSKYFYIFPPQPQIASGDVIVNTLYLLDPHARSTKPLCEETVNNLLKETDKNLAAGIYIYPR